MFSSRVNIYVVNLLNRFIENNVYSGVFKILKINNNRMMFVNGFDNFGNIKILQFSLYYNLDFVFYSTLAVVSTVSVYVTISIFLCCVLYIGACLLYNLERASI